MKHTHRFFISRPLAAGQKACLENQDSFHAGRVLRLRSGDSVELAGSDGRVFMAKVGRSGDLVEATALSEIEGSSQLKELVVAQALPQGRKLEAVVEKLSEIGVAKLVPLRTERSVVRRLDGVAAKLDRWRRVAAAAAKQSRRAVIMHVSEPVAMDEWVSSFSGPVIALTTEMTGSSLGEAVAGTGPPLAVLVGPEAGFSDAELDLLKRNGACFASLGGQVLRTETAALVAASIVMHRLGWLG